MFMGSWLVLAGCGPAAVAADTDTDTDTDTDAGGPDTEGPTGTDPSDTADPTANSMSGSDSDTVATTDDTNDPTEGESESDAETNDTTDSTSSGSTTGTGGDCPLGAEGCLCDIGAQCDDGLDCGEDGICAAPPDCTPLDETPHDDEESAVELEGLGCNEGMELGVIGTIEGPQTDWYTFAGNDSFTCVEQPAGLVSATEDLVVCAFLECNQGDVQDLVCGAESTDSASPQGRLGCCGTNIAFVDDYDCSGFGGKDATVYISVASTEDVCVDYSLEYGF